MKKILAILLSVMMLATMSVTAFAATGSVTPDAGQNIDVTAQYTQGSSSSIVYRVDVEWGSMEFTYKEGSQGTWNPDTHDYDGVTSGSWSCGVDANKITVTNHSNAEVTVKLSTALNDGITGLFTGAAKTQTITSLRIGSAVGTTFEKAPSAVAYFNITGGSISENGKLGTITITME